MKRGEIYYIENINAVGSEQRGIRPAVIVGNDVGINTRPFCSLYILHCNTRKHFRHMYM